MCPRHLPHIHQAWSTSWKSGGWVYTQEVKNLGRQRENQVGLLGTKVIPCKAMHLTVLEQKAQTQPEMFLNIDCHIL